MFLENINILFEKSQLEAFLDWKNKKIYPIIFVLNEEKNVWLIGKLINIYIGFKSKNVPESEQIVTMNGLCMWKENDILIKMWKTIWEMDQNNNKKFYFIDDIENNPELSNLIGFV